MTAQQQEECVMILWLQCRDYWSVLVSCVYKKHRSTAAVNQEKHKSLRISSLQIPFINYGLEKEMKNLKNTDVGKQVWDAV